MYHLHNFEKRLNWVNKTCCSRRNYDRSTDLKLRYKIVPVSFLLMYCCAVSLFRLLINYLPAFKTEFPSTMRIKQHDGSNKFKFDIRKINTFLAGSFVAQAIPISKILQNVAS